MFIQINHLGDEAIKALKKAQPMIGKWEETTYKEAFQEFQEATHYKYLDGGGQAFDCAVLSYQKKKVFNPYKTADGSDIMRKAFFVSDLNRALVEKEMLNGLDRFVKARKGRSYVDKTPA